MSLPMRLARWWSGGPERVSMREGYDRWAPVYPAHPHNALMEAEAAVVEGLIRVSAPRRALDVGTGTGRNLSTLRDAGASCVVGVDLSASMLRHGVAGCPRVRGDAQQLPFAAASFDVVTSSLMSGDVADPGAWVGEAARVLAPGGQLIYSDFHPSWSVSGWRRTFTSGDGREYELPFFPHTIDAHLEQLAHHGLEVRAIREPRVAGPRHAVVVVLHATKPSHRGR
ncbi:MAG: class I SAM-dependent methyltransferase [Vicinamibacterales bacterium]